MSELPSQKDEGRWSIRDLEDQIEMYQLSVWHEKRQPEKKNYYQYLQRSVIATTLPEPTLRSQTETLFEDLQGRLPEKNLEMSLISEKEMIQQNTRQKAPDSAFVLLRRNLTIAKKSPETGQIFHDTSFQVCPRSGSTLRPIIVGEPRPD
jgi:hypothetical protein